MSVPSASDDVDAAFLRACEEIRALFAQAVRDELHTRYRAGALLSVVKRTPLAYGEGAVERIAAELGMAVATLYRYATVAESWSLAEIEDQSRRTNRFGEPLSWSHLVALTRVPNPVSRRALAAQCLAEGWPVRRLTQIITALAGEDALDDDDARADESVRVALTEGIQSATRAAVELSIFAEALQARLADLEVDADAELVARAIDAFEQLHVRAESTLDQLRGATRSSEKRLRCAAPVRVDAASSPDFAFDEEDAEDGSRPRIAVDGAGRGRFRRRG